MSLEWNDLWECEVYCSNEMQTVSGMHGKKNGNMIYDKSDKRFMQTIFIASHK